MSKRFTPYEENTLNGVANWLKTRADMHKHQNDRGLMQRWAEDLNAIINRDAAQVQANLADPCTLDVFHEGTCYFGMLGCTSNHGETIRSNRP